MPRKYAIRAARLALALIAATAAILPTATPAAATSHWQLVGTHPDAVAQPTARGKVLRELHAFRFDGVRIYTGFGDYGENTGPIPITPWSVGNQRWENEGSQNTEEVDNFQEINGALFSPSIDPAWRGALELASNASDYAT